MGERWGKVGPIAQMNPTWAPCGLPIRAGTGFWVVSLRGPQNENGLISEVTAPNHQLFERQDRCGIFSVLCYFRYFVRE